MLKSKAFIHEHNESESDLMLRDILKVIHSILDTFSITCTITYEQHLFKWSTTSLLKKMTKKYISMLSKQFLKLSLKQQYIQRQVTN